MWFRSFLDYLKPRPRRPFRRTPQPRTPLRLQLEALEARCLMTLNPAVNYAVGAFALDVAVGDFNGDGRADMATINATELSVLHGNGDGTFQAAQTTTVGSGLRSLAAAHFDADGRLDLAMTSRIDTWNGTAYVTEGFVNVLLNNGVDVSGNATFQAARSFSTGTNLTPESVALGDLNGDGKLDVATGQLGGRNPTVLLGNGDGSLQSARDVALLGSDPGSVALADINKDGKLDLITANRGSASVSVLLNNGNDVSGNPTFQSARDTSFGSTVESVAVGDFDANGKLDLAVTSSVTTWGGWYYYYATTNGYVNVLLGNGDGTFAAAKTTWANNTQLGDVAVADFNGDGKLDVVTPDAFVQAAVRVDPTVLIGRGDGTFDSPYHFDAGSGPVAIIASDLNGDSAPDVGVANTYSSNVSVLVNDKNWPPPGAPFVSINDVTVTEGNTGTTAAVFTLTLTAAFTQPISIQYSTADGTAIAGNDYQATSGTVNFGAGEISKTVTVLVNGDRLAEPYYGSLYESFFVNLSNPTNVRIADGQATGYIADNEPAITASGPRVIEGNFGTIDAVFNVTMAAASDGPVTVTWYTSDSSATAGSDYQAASGTLTFEPGASLTQTVTVLVNGDRLGENYEYFYLNLGNGTSGYATIVDDEPRISISDVTVTEGNTGTTNAVFTVSLLQAYDEPVSVNFSTAEGDTEWYGGYWGYYGYYYYPPPPAATAGADFQAQTGIVTFAENETSKQITVLVNGDHLAENHEYFSVDLTSASANAGFNDSHGVGIIANDEPSVYFDYYGPTVTEGNTGTTNAVFTVRLAAASAEPVSVEFTTVDGSATAGSDYVAQSGTATIAAGQTTQTITVLVNGDRLGEYYSEYFYVALGNGYTGYATIVDDEPVIGISDVTVTEGNTGTTNAVFTVSLLAAYDEPVSVNFSTFEGDTEAWWGYGYYGYYYPPPAATAGSDFEHNTGTLTFAPGETSKEISVVINGDRLAEDYEYFSVDLAGASANAAFYDRHGLGAIADDEPWVSIDYYGPTVTEGNTGTTDAVFTVRLAAAYDMPVSVNYTTADWTALAGSDYVAQTGTVTFAAGQVTQTIIIAVKGDALVEDNEYFYVNLTGSNEARISSSYSYATILDDDTPPSIRISDASIVEGNSGTTQMVFTVTLSAASGQGVWVNYKTTNGSARTSDNDYLATSGTLYFAPGVTTMTISATIKGDQKKENNETFYLDLFSATNATIVDGRGIGTILDDDKRR